MLHHQLSLSQAKVSRVSALICSKSSSWKLMDESMNRWLPNDFCRQRRAFCRVADPKSSASQQSDGLRCHSAPQKNNWIESKVGLGRFCCCKALGRVRKNSSAGCDHCKNMATGETVPLWGCSCTANENEAGLPEDVLEWRCWALNKKAIESYFSARKWHPSNWVYARCQTSEKHASIPEWWTTLAAKPFKEYMSRCELL